MGRRLFSERSCCMGPRPEQAVSWSRDPSEFLQRFLHRKSTSESRRADTFGRRRQAVTSTDSACFARVKVDRLA